MRQLKEKHKQELKELSQLVHSVADEVLVKKKEENVGAQTLSRKNLFGLGASREISPNL